MSDYVRSREDCCLSVCLPEDAVPALVITADQADTDPEVIELLGETEVPNWPLVFWSNGTLTTGLDPGPSAGG